MKKLMTLVEVAELVPFSVYELRKAIAETDPQASPPPLKAKEKRDSSGRVRAYLVTEQALTEFIDSLPDA